MPLYLVHATDNAGSAEIRARALDEHVAYLQSRAEIVLAGAALTDDGETAHGSVFIVNVPDRAGAEAFSNGDPFTRDGVFSSVNITRVRKGIWQPEAAEDA